jgi:hypothetical protein
MSKKLPIFLATILTAASLSAQGFDLADILYSGEAGIPSPILREPFPWGLAPRNPTMGSLIGNVTEIIQETSYSGYAFEEKSEISKDTTSWVGGSNPGDWFCEGRGAGWSDGESRFYWDEKGNALTEWKGAWEEPAYIKRYQSGSRMPFEYWSRDGDNRDKWHHITTEGEDETWMRSATGLVTKWTCYDGNGSPAKRLLVEKDARAMALRVEYWSDASTKALEILETRADPGFVVKGRKGDSASIEARFQRSYYPVSMVTSLGGSGSWESRYTTDYSGRVSEVLFLHDGKPESRRLITRDQLGNIIAERLLKADSSFGETIFRETSSIRNSISYRKQGELVMATGKPHGLDEWLDVASPGSLAAALQTPDDKAADASSILPLPQPIPDASLAAPSATLPDVQTWQASTELDPLTDAKKYSVRIESALPRSGYADPVTLWASNRGKGLEAFISFGEIIGAKGKLALRFDSEAPIYLNPGEWTPSADGESAYIRGFKVNGTSYGVQDFVNRLTQKKALFVQVQKYDGSQISARFDLPGFKPAVESVLPYDQFISGR